MGGCQLVGEEVDYVADTPAFEFVQVGEAAFLAREGCVLLVLDIQKS